MRCGSTGGINDGFAFFAFALLVGVGVGVVVEGDVAPWRVSALAPAATVVATGRPSYSSTISIYSY